MKLNNVAFASFGTHYFTVDHTNMVKCITQLSTITCMFAPRKEYNGINLLSELREHIDEIVQLKVLWLMSDEDPYPGEWALGAVDGGLIFGRTWLASGDFKICED